VNVWLGLFLFFLTAPKENFMSDEKQETSAPAEATAETADTQESQVSSEAGESKEVGTQYEPYTVPEGFEIDGTVKADLDGLFQDVNLDQATAQKMVDKHFEILGKQKKNYEDQMESQRQGWASEAMADKEFGGSALSENMAGARKAMNSFSQPAVDSEGKAILSTEGPTKGQQMTEIEVLMNASGWGNHPAMIRVFHRIGKALSEDHFVAGDMRPREEKKTAAQVMYPSMNQ
tara:strand:- start:17 stop:715 length:699 start_codon:yes stop_codon:yes gene_type:complete